MQSTAQRFDVPAGFSGWWCYRKCGAVEIDDTLGSPARCPKCHKPTAVWVPKSEVSSGQVSRRQPAGRALQSEMAGAPWQRKMPTAEDARRLFDHVRNVIEHPDLEPDLRKIDEEDAKR